MPELSIPEASDNLSAAVAGLATNEEQRKQIERAMADYINAVNAATTKLAISAGQLFALPQQQQIDALERRFATLLELLEARDHE